MSQRLYFLLPDLASAQRTTNDLLLSRVEERHIHFLAKEGVDLTGLHQANVFQSSDIVHGAESGLVIGGATGVAAGIVAALYPIIGKGPEWGMIPVTTILGGLFGAWVASMIGSSVPNIRLRPFQQAIERGEILLMVDVPRSRAEEVKAVLARSHPEAHAEGAEPAIPAFP